MKLKTIKIEVPQSGFPHHAATLILKSGAKASSIAISVAMGTGDLRSARPRSIQGCPRITITDISTGKETYINANWHKM